MKGLGHLTFFFSRKDTSVIGLVFGLNSIVFGNWVTRIPDVKERIGLSDTDLGLALLGAPIGAILVIPFAGWLISKFKIGRTSWVSAVLHFISLIFLSLADTHFTLGLAMAYFGLTNAILDISMNAAAAATEKKLRKHIMSTCHGMWSLGAMVGSASGSIMVGLGLSYPIHLVFVVVVVLIPTILFYKTINSYQEEQNTGDKIFALPNLSLLGLAFMAFCILLSEGAIADWSAIYMKETLLSNPYLVGLAFSSYAFLMAIGRFFGDSIIPRVGKKKTVFTGAVIGVLGLGSTLVINDPYFAIAGFGLTGLGFSCIVPVLFSSAANEPGFSPGTGIASVTIIGYSGFLAGPPFIGWIADQYSMPIALSLVVILSVIVSIMAIRINFK